MKKVFLLLIVFAWVKTSFAQEVDPALFLFDDYTEGTVLMKNGAKSKGKLNFYLPKGEFFYIDDQDGNKIKALANSDDVYLIEIGSRRFFPSEHGGLEILSPDPAFYVRHCITFQQKEKTVGFGGTSTLGQVKTYSGNSAGDAFTSIPIDIKPGNRYNIYWVEHKGKQKEVRNMKQFIKLFSKQKAQLQEYIDAKNVDFNDATAMLSLFRYACQLGQ
ncbi:MAG: hypothetical protein IKK07_06605 [Bacteroides sp.]|nr:hypothetical protein [Bacteroides sp.]